MDTLKEAHLVFYIASPNYLVYRLHIINIAPTMTCLNRVHIWNILNRHTGAGTPGNHMGLLMAMSLQTWVLVNTLICFQSQTQVQFPTLPENGPPTATLVFSLAHELQASMSLIFQATELLPAIGMKYHLSSNSITRILLLMAGDIQDMYSVLQCCQIQPDGSSM